MAIMFQNDGAINSYLGLSVSKISSKMTSETMYYKTAYTSDGVPSGEGLEALNKKEKSFCIQEESEGAVLVKNGDVDGSKALPLGKNETKVTLFGRAAADPIYKCRSGGPTADTTKLINLPTALNNDGITINQTVYDALASSTVKRNLGTTGVLGTASIGELDPSFYDSYTSTYSSYSDAAIVVFSRYGGEGNDLQTTDADGISELALHPSEANLLKSIKGKFKKVIVLLNSGYPLELGYLEKEEYGVDACLWIGNPGNYGFQGVADLLVGKSSPSGRFVDTYATDSLSSPAVQNFGSIQWNNSNWVESESISGNKVDNYVVEAEGIYTGYKYYETRYADALLGADNASNIDYGGYASKKENGGNGSIWSYSDEIAYPFGYGLSYTDFTEEIVDGSFKRSAKEDGTGYNFTMDVKVTNTGSVAGKDSVLLYVSAPYTSYDKNNGLAKSAIQLLEYGKTDSIEPGESETITLTVDDYLLASYDETYSHGGVVGGYVIEDGNYYFGIGDDAHEALNNIMMEKSLNENLSYKHDYTDEFGNTLTAKSEDELKGLTAIYSQEGHVDGFDSTYCTSQYTGELIQNRFSSDSDTPVDINDILGENTVTYLSRTDYATFPKTCRLDGNDTLVSLLNKRYEKPDDAPSYDSFTQKEDSDLKFIDMKDVDYDDPKWDTFINQLSEKDMLSLLDDSMGNVEIKSVSKPANINHDGPDGWVPAYKYGSKGTSTLYCGEIVSSSAFNKDLLEERGTLLAEDAIYCHLSQGWCPGADIHRTPFSGRNFEYYSEDSYLSYIDGGIQCKAMQEGGCMAAIKHFCGNDQETHREGLSTFMSEQALRQGPIKGFEGAFTIGGALATMGTTSRIGATSASTSYALNTEVLRGEFGFKGSVITDALTEENVATTDPLMCLVGGSDMYCMNSHSGKVKAKLDEGDGYILSLVRQSNKRYYYAYVHSNLINGLSHETTVASDFPWWKGVTIGLISFFGASEVVLVGLYAFFKIKERKHEDEKAA